MKLILLFFLFFIAAILESTIVQLPLVLLLLLCVTIIYKNEFVFFIGLLSGSILDALSFRPIGESSMFFLLFLFCIFLYERKFELRSISFVIFMSCIGSIVFFFLFGSSILILQVLTSIFIAVLLFSGLSFFYPIPSRENLNSWKR